MRFITVSLVVVIAACRVEDNFAPMRLDPTAVAPATLVPPDYKYVGTAYPFEGNFNDVNDGGLVVGMGNFKAVALRLGGSVQTMSSGRFQDAEAHAVNEVDVIVGTVYQGAWLNSDGSPAIWSNLGAFPLVLNENGTANDVNDAGLVVGTLTRKGLGHGYAWQPAKRVLELLPPLSGGKQTSAVAVNNERVILGWSEDKSGGFVSVIWQHNGTAWVPQHIKGIDGYDIDGWKGVVGTSSNRASYGSPDFSGYLGTTSNSNASGISRNGLIAGFDAGASLGWPSYGRGFVADRNGAVSYLPDPAGGNWWRRSTANAVNSCGVAVGYDWPFPAYSFTQQPVVWNPGC